jgi:hypothetical protein
VLIVVPAIAAFSCAGERTPASERTPAASAVQTDSTLACSLIDTLALKGLGPRKLIAYLPPAAYFGADPGVTRCDYLGYTFELTFPAKPEDLQDILTVYQDNSTKVQAVSGVGEQAYVWWTVGPKTAYHQVGVIIREKSSILNIMDVATSDSIEIKKPGVLAVAKLLAPNLK